jgi:peptidoglycan/xylan/chitin deacetylase (PgdA/CDA1 family)
MYSQQVAVLAYHHLSDTAKSNVTITPELFRDQLVYLLKHNYRFITLKQFRQFLQGGAVPDNSVLVTFDDGYESFYQYGYPILKELGIPAVNFVITGDLDNPQGSTIPSLSKTEIEQMVQQPDFIDVQCHSDRLHAKVNNDEALLTSFVAVNGALETEEQYERRIVRDTDQCIGKLSALYPPERPTAIDFYAYPFGDYDSEASRLVQESGIRYAFTVVSEMALQTDDPLQIPRITAGNPSITPERLHQSIMRKVVDLERTFDYISLRDGVGQIGGTLLKDADGNISFNYHEKSWVVHTDTLTIAKDGQTIPLDHPLKVARRRLYIDFHDLERVMNVHITYDPVNYKFYERVTPAR